MDIYMKELALNQPPDNRGPFEKQRSLDLDIIINPLMDA
jgi:hypothetical protein